MLRFGLIAAALVASVSGAGVYEPVQIRSVVIDGVRGLGYYSIVEQGFRMVGGFPETPLESDVPLSARTQTAAVDDNEIVSADELSQAAFSANGPDDEL